MLQAFCPNKYHFGQVDVISDARQHIILLTQSKFPNQLKDNIRKGEPITSLISEHNGLTSRLSLTRIVDKKV